VGLLLASCAPQTETIIETVIVEKEGETIIETVEVEVVKEVEVEKEVVVTVEVEVEVIVDPTECNLEAPAEEVEINLISGSFPITDFYAEEVEKCDKVENLTVNTSLLLSADKDEQVNLALSAGGDSPYDIVQGANSNVGPWVGNGWLMPLNDLIEKYRDEYDLDDIPEKAWEGVTIDGNIYGVPIVFNTLHLMYNSDVFAEYGVDVPDNYDEVIDICNTIGLDNPDFDNPYTINLSAGWAWEIEFFQMIRAFGGDYLDDDNMPIFNSEAGVNAANKLVEVADACMGDVGYSFGNNDIEVAIQLGTLPFTNLWASRAANMGDPERTDLVGVIKFAPAPRATADGLRAGSAWNDFYFIPANTTNDPDLIFQVIMEAADARSQREAAEIGLATRQSAAEYGGPYLDAVVQTIAEGIGSYDTDPAVGIVVSTLSQYLPLIGTGEMTAQEALDAAAADYTTEATAQGYID